MKKLRIGAIVGALVLAMGLCVAPSNAASTSVGGTVNYTGSYTTYSTQRKMLEPYQSQIYLGKAAHSARGGVGMALGTHTSVASHRKVSFLRTVGLLSKKATDTLRERVSEQEPVWTDPAVLAVIPGVAT